MDITGYAFISGGASGIRKATCYAFAEEGAHGVVVADLTLDAAKETAQGIKAVAKHPDFRAEAIHIDVRSEDSVKTAISHTITSFGRIDYCVHCAGVPQGKPNSIAEASFPEFEHILGVNTNGTFLVTSLISAAMKAQEPKQVSTSCPERGTTRGAIVNLASMAAYVVLPNVVQYIASKHAVVGITKGAAIDNTAHGIRLNCICPTRIDTPMAKKAIESTPGLEYSHLTASIPMDRIGRPEEVADMALFLCSPRSSFTTGAGITVDGGMNLI